MLYLTRKIGESIVINDEVELTIVEIKGKTAKLGITFPPSATVLRKELYDHIHEENRAASQGGLSDDSDTDAMLEALGFSPKREE